MTDMNRNRLAEPHWNIVDGPDSLDDRFAAEVIRPEAIKTHKKGLNQLLIEQPQEVKPERFRRLRTDFLCLIGVSMLAGR